MEDDNLFVSVTVRDPSGSIRVVSNNTINGALLQRTTIKSYLQSKYRYEKVVRFEPFFHRARPPTKNFKILDLDFKELWKRCKSKAAKNKTYLYIWDEIPELLALGEEILEFILTK